MNIDNLNLDIYTFKWKYWNPEIEREWLAWLKIIWYFLFSLKMRGGLYHKKNDYNLQWNVQLNDMKYTPAHVHQYQNILV